MPLIKVGLIGNSDAFIPTAYTIASALKGQVHVFVFYSPTPDVSINHKVDGFIRQTGIPCTVEADADRDIYEWLNKGSFDACFILGYPYFIRLKRLKALHTSLFNIHFGPLPAFKGPSPVFWQLKKGEAKLGVVIHRLTDVVDAGPVVWRKDSANLPHYNYRLVYQLFSQLCVEGVFFILSALIYQIPLEPVITPQGLITSHHQRPALNDILINWQTMGAWEVCNLIRACNPWNKGAISFFNQQEIKLIDGYVADHLVAAADTVPGSILFNQEYLSVCCHDSILINITMLYLDDYYLPARWCKHAGFTIGQKLG
jgi:methionyl-tRNA formyltransferase